MEESIGRGDIQYDALETISTIQSASGKTTFHLDTISGKQKSISRKGGLAQ